MWLTMIDMGITHKLVIAATAIFPIIRFKATQLYTYLSGYIRGSIMDLLALNTVVRFRSQLARRRKSQ